MGSGWTSKHSGGETRKKENERLGSTNEHRVSLDKRESRAGNTRHYFIKVLCIFKFTDVPQGHSSSLDGLMGGFITRLR